MNKTIINDLIILETFKKNHRTHYRFQCVCGKIGEARTTKIDSGYTKSCGCRRAKIHQPKNTPLPPRNSAENKLMWYMIYDANKRGIDFKLTKKQFMELVTSPCSYCGIPHVSKMEHKNDILNYNGIDRIDPDKGYIKQNVKPCCKYCNLAKARMSEEEFLTWLQRAYLFNYGPIINSVNSVNTLQKGNTELSLGLTS